MSSIHQAHDSVPTEVRCSMYHTVHCPYRSSVRSAGTQGTRFRSSLCELATRFLSVRREAVCVINVCVIVRGRWKTALLEALNKDALYSKSTWA